MTRPHADLELAVCRADQLRLQQHLSHWTFVKVVGGRREPWPVGDWLSLPVHEVHARPCDEPSVGGEFLLNERDARDWVFRRDVRVTLPIGRAMLHVPAGVPVLAPEIVLLFKAKSPRPKGEQDFQACRPALDEHQRLWLCASLRLIHPDHEWASAVSP